jgi:putative nucleotidyltransferase with HDIG domain
MLDDIKKYKISDIRSGMIVGRDILFGDNVALSAGIQLNDNLISSIEFLGVDEVYIVEKVANNKIINAINPETIQQKFFYGYSKNVDKIKDAFRNIHDFKQFFGTEIFDLTKSNILPLINTSGAINHLQLLGGQDEYTLEHSLNVAIICGILGKWLGYKDKELVQLISAGLLHDVGKIEISNELLNKKGKLTTKEMNIMKLHTEIGGRLLKNSSDVPDNILCGVLQHHERMDGSGYPHHLKGNDIHPFARIIAVSDVYDALSSDFSYKRKDNPFKLLEVIHEEMFNKLDPTVCSVFVRHVRDYFNENIVELSNGRTAEVVKMGHFFNSRPMVKTNNGMFIDLEKENSIKIVKLIEVM